MVSNYPIPYSSCRKPPQFPTDFKMQIKMRYSKLLFVYSWTPWQISPCVVNNGCIEQPSLRRISRYITHSRCPPGQRGIQMLLCISAGNTVVISKRVCVARASGYVSRMKSLRRSAPVDGRTDSTVQSRRWRGCVNCNAVLRISVRENER